MQINGYNSEQDRFYLSVHGTTWNYLKTMQDEDSDLSFSECEFDQDESLRFFQEKGAIKINDVAILENKQKIDEFVFHEFKSNYVDKHLNNANLIKVEFKNIKCCAKVLDQIIEIINSYKNDGESLQSFKLCRPIGVKEIAVENVNQLAQNSSQLEEIQVSYISDKSTSFRTKWVDFVHRVTQSS